MRECNGNALRKRWVVLFIGALVLGGWVDPGASRAGVFLAAPTAPEGFATLYIFRPNEGDYAAGVWPVTFFNDIKVVDVKANRYTSVYIWPGEYKIHSKRSGWFSGMGNQPFTLTIPSAGNYYLEFSTGVSGSTTLAIGGAFITLNSPGSKSEGWHLVAEPEAQTLIGETHFIQPYVERVGH